VKNTLPKAGLYPLPKKKRSSHVSVKRNRKRKATDYHKKIKLFKFQH